MQEELKPITVVQVKEHLKVIEKLKNARNEQQYQVVFDTFRQLEILCDSDELSQEITNYLPDILLISVNFLLNHKQYPDRFVFDIEQYLKCILKYIIKQLHTHNPKLSDIFRIIMDPNRMIYEYNAHQTDIHESIQQELKSYSYLLNPNYAQFINNLQINQMVDCLKLDRGTNRMNWSRGIIRKIENEIITIRYQNDISDEINIKIRSGHIMPYLSRSQEIDQLMNLKIGDIIMGTQTDKWIPSTIKDVIKSQNEYNESVIKYDIAFRIYNNDGDNIEEETNQRYFGLNKHHDEFINATNPRLSIKKYIIRNADTTYIDDTLDDLYIQDYQQCQFYAILRPKLSKSMILINLINYFGSINGFQAIIQTIQNNSDNWIPIDILANYLQGIGNIHAQLFKQFAQQYIPQLTQSISDTLLKAPELVIRNMGREKMLSIIFASLQLLDRIKTIEDRKKWIQDLCLDFVIICFNCNFLDKQILGLKLLSDLLKEAHNEKSASSEQYLLQWISQHNILQRIFAHGTHLQLLARANDLIRVFLMIEQALSAKEMSMIWELMLQKDAELRPTIFKLMSDISVSMRDYHIQYFQNCIASSPLEELVVEHIQFIYDMNRYQIKNQGLVFQAIQILWKIVEFRANDLFSNPNVLEEKARFHVSDLLKNLEMKEDKIQMIKVMIQNIANQKVESSSFKTLSHLIASFPPASQNKVNQYTQEEVVSDFLKEGLQNIILDSLSTLRQRAKAIPQPWTIEQQAIYMNRLQERILLIKSLIRINKTANGIISQSFLNTIWNELILQSFCKPECDVASNWLRELIEKEKNLQFQMIICQFYELNFSNYQNLSQLTENGFDCFSSLLTEVNQRQKYIIKSESVLPPGITATYNSLGQITQMTNTSTEDDKVEPEYQVVIHPDKIIGIDYLWHIVYESNSKSITLPQKAANLLVKLHLNSNDLDVSNNKIHRKEILTQFIQKIINLMKQSNNNVQRSILLLIQLLNESEINGIGSLKSLVGLTKGEQFTLSIQNELTLEPKKSQLKVYSSQTLMELRIQIAKQINTSWDQVHIQRANLFNQNREVPDQDNGKTLTQIGIKKSENLIITRRKTPQIPQVSLINEDGELIDVFLKIATKWFDEFSVDGKMNNEQLAKFITKAVGDLCTVQDSRVKEFISDYVKTDDQLIRLPNFLEFYKDSCGKNKNLSAVWKNLHQFNYRNDLRNLSEIQNVEIDEEALPRYILARHEDFFNLAFGLMRGDTEIATECWKLLNTLPLSEHVRKQIIMLKSHLDWNAVFPKDEPYHLLYCLKVVEYLLGEESSEWRQDFIQCDGFSELLSILLQSVKKENNQIQKQLQIFVLQIFKNYLAGALQPDCSLIYQIQQHTKQPIQASLDQINQALDQTRETSDVNLQKIKSKAKEPEDFWKLVDDLKKNNMNQKIISDINGEQLMNFMENIMLLALAKEEIDPDEKLIIENCIILITTLLSSDMQGISNYFINQKNTYKLIFKKCLFIHKQMLIRKYCSNALYLIFKTQVQLGSTLIRILLDIFPDTENKDSQQYFDVLCKLIEEQPQPDISQYQELAQLMMKSIQEYETTEQRSNQFNDKTLCGYLAMLESLVKVKPNLINQQFAMYLYKVCLFCFQLELPDVIPDQNIIEDYKPLNYVKCKSPESRKIVYKILVLYFRQDINAFTQIVNLPELIYLIPVFNVFDYKPSKEMKNYLGYVGIRNLGCICYMNAMMQQFYMTPEFRYAMLRANDGKQNNIQTFKDPNGSEYKIDDNLIHQFQRMLAYLELTDRPDFNPFQFCQSFKDYDNKPIIVSLQQDAQEFLNQFFDKLDTGLEETGWNQFIKGVYGGNTCSQMICQGCKNLKEKIDLFYTLSVQVKGVKNVFESFESMINGETIKEYFCDNCQNKCDLLKRQCLQALPNVMIVHLQRIVFNLDTVQNEKLSTRLEFPFQLNMYPYTREGLIAKESGINIESPHPQEYYEYKLKGVVVHKGTAQYGHYYSLINHKQDKWMKFNDSVIEDFDIRKLSMECFGGKESEEGTQEFWSSGVDVSSTNAYVLVYERQQKEQLKIIYKDEQMKQNIAKKFNINKQDQKQEQELEQIVQYNSLDKYLPQQLYQEIWWDNHKFMFERHIYCDEFFRFVKELSEQIPFPEDYIKITNFDQELPYCGIYNKYMEITNPIYEQLIGCLTHLMLEVLSRSLDHSTIKDYVVIIKNLINLVPTKVYIVFKQCFAERSQRLFQLFLTTPDSNIRQAIGSLLLHFLNVIIYIHNLNLDINLLQVMQTEDAVIICEQTVIKFLLEMINKLPNDVAKNASKFSQYFDFFRDFIKSGQQQFLFANQIHLVSILADFFMEKGSPLWSSQAEPNPIQFNFGEKKYQLSSKVNIPFYSPIFQSIAYMITNQYKLSQNDELCLNNKFFYQKAVTECQDLNSLTSIITRMVWGQEQLSRILCDVLLESICKANYENLQPLLHISYHLLNVVDDLQLQRIEWILGFPEPQFVNMTEYTTGCPTNLNQQTINYITLISPSDTNTQSILNHLFTNAKRYQNLSLQLIKFLLYSANNNKLVFSHLINMPPPNYIFNKYIDWFESFLRDYQAEALAYPTVSNAIFFNKSKEIEETLGQYTIFKENVKIFLESCMIEQINGSIYPLYMLGQTISVSLIRDIILADNIILKCYEYTVYLAQSKPSIIQTTNEIFDQRILYDNIYVQTSKIDPKSNINNLLVQKFSCAVPKPPPLPLALSVNTNKNLVDGIDFSTETGSKEQQKVNDDFMNELSKFSMDLEAIPESKNTIPAIVVANEPQVQVPPQEQYVIDVDLSKVIYLRRYMIKNNCTSSVNSTFQILIDTDQFVNFRYPKKVCKQILPQSETYLITLMKTIPNLDWGEYFEEVNLQFQEEVNKEQKASTDNITSTNKKIVRIDAQVSEYPAAQSVGTEPEYGPQLPNEINDTINCPECTYLQASSNHFCELCTTQFK